MFYMMFKFKPKKALSISYITWASSKEKAWKYFKQWQTIFGKKKTSGAFKQLQWFIAVMSLFDSISVYVYIYYRKEQHEARCWRWSTWGQTRAGKAEWSSTYRLLQVIDAPNSLASFFSLKVFIISCEMYYWQV